MTISLEIDRTENHEGPALSLTWAIGPTHLPDDVGRGWLRFGAELSPGEAFAASEALIDAFDQMGRTPDAMTVPTVTSGGAVVPVTAPRAWWRAVSNALEIAAARLGVGADVRQRIDLTPDGQVTRASAAPNGWQLLTPGA